MRAMRKQILSIIVLAAATGLGIGSSGCNLNGVCGAAMPLIQGAIIYGDDAEASLNRVQLMFDSMQLPEALAKKVEVAMAKAWDALRGAQHALIGANDACAKVDIMLVFAEFIQAWKHVSSLLSESSPNLQAGALEAYAPAIVRKADGK